MGEVALSLCVTPLMLFAEMGPTCLAKAPMPQLINHVDNRFSGICVSESTSSLLSEGPDVMKTRPCLIQGRSLSECSVDSEDSFIVFHDSPGSLACNWNSEEAGCFDYSDSSSDEDEEMLVMQTSDWESNGFDSDAEDEDDTIEDTCDGISQRLQEVNQRWQLENPPIVHKKKSDIHGKQVCFAPAETLQSIHPIIAWDYAYRASRVGPWEEMARDRARFKTRIQDMEAILAPVLNPMHRSKVLERTQETALLTGPCDLF